MKARFNQFTGKPVIIAALTAFPAMVMAANIDIIADYTGPASGLDPTNIPGGSWGGNNLRLGTGATGKSITIDSGTLSGTNNGTNSFEVGGTSNTVTFTGSSTAVIVNASKGWPTGSVHMRGTANTMKVLAGATFTANGYFGFDGSGAQTIVVDGAGSKVDVSADRSDGFGPTNGQALDRRINITNGGTFYISGNGMDQMTSNTAGTYAVNVDGAGGRSVLGVTLIQYNSTAAGGIAHIFNGGALETHIDNGGNNSFGSNGDGHFDKVFIDGGVISYKDSTAARMDESTAGSASGFTYAGNNAMRLNNGAATDTGSYTLANNVGATPSKNYTRLEMINGITSVARAITVDGDNRGSLLFDSTAATIAAGVTLTGASATLKATGAASTLTGAVTGGSGNALVKSGSAKLTLKSTPTYSGDTTIDEGTLALASPNISNETSTVTIATAAKLELDFDKSGGPVTDTVDKLFIDVNQMPAGIYGATGSGATHIDDTHFVGVGTLTVTSGGGGGATYALTYDGNAQTTGSAPTDTSSPYASAVTVTVLGNTGSLVKTGHTFSGWNEAANGSGTSHTASSTFPMPAAALTLYAQWTINSYTLTYGVSGSHGSIVGTSPQSVNYGSNGGLVTATPDSAYYFAGWSDAYPTAVRTDLNVSADLNVTASFAINYSSWASANGIAGQAAKDDKDNDGVANAAELVVGGNPATGMDADKLPTIQLVTNPGGTIPDGNYMLFTYRRTTLSLDAGIATACQYNTDLGAVWAPAVDGSGGVKVITTTGHYGTGIDRIQVYVPRAANTKMFGRLDVIVPPAP